MTDVRAFCNLREDVWLPVVQPTDTPFTPTGDSCTQHCVDSVARWAWEIVGGGWALAESGAVAKPPDIAHAEVRARAVCIRDVASAFTLAL